MEATPKEATMTLAFRVVAVSLTLSVLVASVPLAAAQQPAQPQPEVFKETMKDPGPTERLPGDFQLSEGWYSVAAFVFSGFLIPGRMVTCALGSGVGVAVLVLTIGTQPRAAMAAVEEGCGGKWIVRGEDLMRDRPPITQPGNR
jgi:hypothetical protein